MEVYRRGHNGPARRLRPPKAVIRYNGVADLISHIAKLQSNIKWKCIEEVITALTRNQVYGNVSWVRIPPLPPSKKDTFHGVFFTW